MVSFRPKPSCGSAKHIGLTLSLSMWISLAGEPFSDSLCNLCVVYGEERWFDSDVVLSREVGRWFDYYVDRAEERIYKVIATCRGKSS